MKKTRLCEILGIEYPVIQAPMNWITDAVLAAAVSNAGGLGVIGLNAGERTLTDSVQETGERLRRQINMARSLTAKPFGVNLMAVEVPVGYPEGGQAFSDRCLEVIIEEAVPIVVVVGNAPAMYMRRLKKAGAGVLFRGIPESVAVARNAEAEGIDAFIAVGFEGGGHTGTDIPSSVLVPQIVDALRIPVVAGGGIVNGRGLAAALAWGAQAVFMGTRFITTTECPAHPEAKRAIIEADEAGTVAICGVLGVVRNLRTPLMERCAEMELAGIEPAEITRLYASGYTDGMLRGNIGGGTVGCGAGCGLIRELKDAAEVVRDVVVEAQRILDSLQESPSTGELE
jgi:enoyl-[acyl-carrier protein] reductase II